MLLCEAQGLGCFDVASLDPTDVLGSNPSGVMSFRHPVIQSPDISRKIPRLVHVTTIFQKETLQR